MTKIKIDKDNVLKVIGWGCAGAGMIISALVTKKDNDKAIEKAVKDYLDKK